MKHALQGPGLSFMNYQKETCAYRDSVPKISVLGFRLVRVGQGEESNSNRRNETGLIYSYRAVFCHVYCFNCLTPSR
jgi:hypothetical protein